MTKESKPVVDYLFTKESLDSLKACYMDIFIDGGMHPKKAEELVDFMTTHNPYYLNKEQAVELEKILKED